MGNPVLSNDSLPGVGTSRHSGIRGRALRIRVLVNTPLQRGDRTRCCLLNRFNGLVVARETVETVRKARVSLLTPLKRGVNESFTSGALLSSL